MLVDSSAVERIKGDMQGLWLPAVGVALLCTSTASMRFTAMQGIYPLELSLLARHIVSLILVVLAAVAAAHCGQVAPKTWSRAGIASAIMLSVCFVLSNGDALSPGGWGIPSYVASILEEGVAALVLALWIAALLPLGARALLVALGMSAILQALIQLVTCWLQYLPHLVLIAILPLGSAALFALFVTNDRQMAVGWHDSLASACRRVCSRVGTPRIFAVLLLLFCLMFIIGHIIYMSLETQQAMADSAFAEISMALGNLAGGLFVLFMAYRLTSPATLSVVLFTMVASIGLAFYLSTFAGGVVVGFYLALSSAMLKGLYALIPFFAVLVFPHESRDARLAGYLLLTADIFLARCLSSVFMISQNEASGTAYNIAVAVALALAIGCCIVLMQNASITSATTSGHADIWETLRSESGTESTVLSNFASPLDQLDAAAIQHQTQEQGLDVALDPDDERGTDDAEDESPHPTPFKEAIEVASADAGLTPQERNVLVLLAQGRNARSISNAMTLSMNTVRSHMRNVYAKLGVHSQQELIDAINSHVDEARQNQQNPRS